MNNIFNKVTPCNRLNEINQLFEATNIKFSKLKIFVINYCFYFEVFKSIQPIPRVFNLY